MAQDVFGFGLELDDLAIDSLLKRMPDQRLVLVVLDTHGMWPLLVVRPGQKPGHPVPGTLEPRGADDRDCRQLGPALLDAARRELIDLLTAERVLIVESSRGSCRAPGARGA
jgi:hypothetical protein